MGFESLGVGLDGAAIKAGGFVGFVLGVGDVSGVEQGAGVRGVIGEPRGELGFGGFPVGFDDEGFGVEDRLRAGVWARGRLSPGEKRLAAGSGS